jgi:hypothetical protein
LILAFSGAVSIALSSYAAYMYFSGRSEIIGEPLVNAEFPPQTVSPIYMKPVTWLMISSAVAWYSLLEVIKERVVAPNGSSRYPRGVSLVLAILFLIALVSFYEVLFNFILWASLMAHVQPGEPFNPDTLVNPYPSDGYKVNLTFATKVGVSILGCSVYGIYVFKDLNNRQSS